MLIDVRGAQSGTAARLKREKLFKTMMHVRVRARRHTHTVLGKLLCKRNGLQFQVTLLKMH